MEESKKKPIMIGVIVGCLVLAGVITVMTRSGGSGSTVQFEGQPMWVKCNNPDCGVEYEMDMKEYFDYIQEHMRGPVTPLLPCKQCGEESVYRAVKCPKCEHVFLYGAASDAGDFFDRCPECGYSETEETRKQRREGL